MRVSDVVAWADTEAGRVICLECTSTKEAERKDWAPVFAGSEWDSFPSCDRCTDGIYDVGLTTDGIDFHREWLASAGGRMTVAEAAACDRNLGELLNAMGELGVGTDEIRVEHGDGTVTLAFVPAGMECPEGLHQYDDSGECIVCSKEEGP